MRLIVATETLVKLKVQLHLHPISTQRCFVFQYVLGILEEMAAATQTGQSAVEAYSRYSVAYL